MNMRNILCEQEAHISMTVAISSKHYCVNLNLKVPFNVSNSKVCLAVGERTILYQVTLHFNTEEFIPTRENDFNPCIQL